LVKLNRDDIPPPVEVVPEEHIEVVNSLEGIGYAGNPFPIEGTDDETNLSFKYDGSHWYVQGPKLSQHEPYFILRGNDRLAMDTLLYYMEFYTMIVGPEVDIQNDVNYQSLLALIKQFQEYQSRFSARVKMPD